MNNLQVRIENVKLHNKLQNIKKKEEERLNEIEKSKSKMKMFIEDKLEELKKENEKIKKEKEELEKRYNAIPKWIRSIFVNK